MTQLAPSPKKRAAARMPSNPLPQSREDIESRLSVIAECRALIAERVAILESDRAEAERIYSTTVAPIERQIAKLEAEVHAWCEAHRAEITRNGKAKTVKFLNGEVAWKNGKASVALTDKEEAIIAALKRLKLASYVRTTESVDKQMVLKAPERVAKVPGITVKPGAETFGITARAPAKERV